MLFYEKFITVILLSIREKEYVKYNKKSFLNYEKVIDKDKKELIKTEILSQMINFKGCFSILLSISIIISFVVILPLVALITSSIQNLVVENENLIRIHPLLIVNCVYDTECNEPIKNLNIHQESDIYAINKRALTYYHNFIITHPDYNAFAESSYNQIMAKKYIKHPN